MNQNIENQNINCCISECERPLDQNYWNTQWNSNATGWDIGFASPAIVDYLKKYMNKDASILIPGCGNAYEAEFLLNNGFTNITLIDIAPKAVEILQNKFSDSKNIKIICEDFFLHSTKYDLIIEQTFFCALPPFLRPRYVWKMHQLLNDNSRLIGLLFNRTFEKSPPFGGSENEYKKLFDSAFSWDELQISELSIPQRIGTELFIDFQKNTNCEVNLYQFKGITCSDCVNTVSMKMLELENILNVQMSSDFRELLIVSKEKISINTLQEIVSYDSNYHIEPWKM